MLIIQNTKTYKTLGTMVEFVGHKMQGDKSLIKRSFNERT